MHFDRQWRLANLKGSYIDARLARLISDYQGAVGEAILLMSQSGIRVPSSGVEWLESDVPKTGILKGDVGYYKHDYGCSVTLAAGSVDFDFGRHGDTDEFDAWRLWKFSRGGSRRYDLDSQALVWDAFRRAVEDGSLVASTGGLYFVADSMQLLGEVNARILRQGCALPHYSKDCLQLLSSQCFDSADVMLKLLLPLDKQWRKEQRLNQADGVKFSVYLLSWLGYLHSTAEGFRSSRVRLLLETKRPPSFLGLLPELDQLGKLQKKHADDLRVLRNDTFHLRSGTQAITRFFSDEGERIIWARGVHCAFASFFSNYRVLAKVHYVLSGRDGESQFREASARCGKKGTATRSVPRMPRPRRAKSIETLD